MLEWNLDRLMFDNDKMSVLELSKQTGISRATLYRMCNNTAANVSLYNCERMCTVLGCSFGDLVREKKEKKR
jgi:DNA-binding Xre family transcriptional regulator